MRQNFIYTMRKGYYYTERHLKPVWKFYIYFKMLFRRINKYKLFIIILLLFLLFLMVKLYLCSLPIRYEVDINAEEWQENVEEDKGLKLLTLFTTLPSNKTRLRYNNMLKNWRVLAKSGNLNTILFADDPESKIAKEASKMGWTVLLPPRVNKYGSPYIKDMYKVAQQQFSSLYYGYSNADILFTNRLFETLRAIKRRYIKKLGTVLITGIRTELGIDQPMWEPNDIEKIAKGKNLSTPDTADYYIIYKNIFPWEKFQDLLVGHPKVDNYFLAFAMYYDIPTIECTKTILGAHPKHGERGTGILTDYFENELVLKKLRWTKNYVNPYTGYHYNIKYETDYVNHTGVISLYERANLYKFRTLTLCKHK